MRKLMLMASAFLLLISVKAQNECIEDVGDKMCLVSNEGKFGIKNKKGDYIVPAYFDELQVFGTGFLVKQNGKYGLFDRKGKIVIPIEFAGIRCIGDCDNDFIYEISDIGMKSIYVTKKMDVIAGFDKVSPLLTMSTFEISIKDWFIYLQNVKENGYNYNYGYESVLPDTTKVEPKLLPAYRAFLKALKADNVDGMAEVKSLFGYLSAKRLAAYCDNSLYDTKMDNMMNFPVTGITYEHAKRYCEWLTVFYRNEVNNEDDLSYEINFRLPKLEEWEKIAESGLQDRFKANKSIDSLNIEGCMLFNFNASAKCKNYDDYLKNSFGKGSAMVSAYWPDNNGIFGLCGNVAEMVFENGLAKGGSYDHFAKAAAWDKTIEYEGAQPWLGFRVVAEFKAIE